MAWFGQSSHTMSSEFWVFKDLILYCHQEGRKWELDSSWSSVREGEVCSSARLCHSFQRTCFGNNLCLQFLMEHLLDSWNRENSEDEGSFCLFAQAFSRINVFLPLSLCWCLCLCRVSKIETLMSSIEWLANSPRYSNAAQSMAMVILTGGILVFIFFPRDKMVLWYDANAGKIAAFKIKMRTIVLKWSNADT